MKLKIILIIALLLFTNQLVVVSQEFPREWILTLQAAVTKYYGDYTDDRFQSGGSISIKHFYKSLDKHSALYFDLTLSGYELDYKTTSDMMKYFKDSPEIKIGEVNRTFVAPLQFQLLWRKLIGPDGELFLGGGLEFGYFQPYNHSGYPLPKVDDYGKWFFGIPLTAQFEYVLSDQLALNFHSTLHFTFNDYLDGTSAGTGSDAYLTAGLGFSYSFPAPDRDSDYDGLTNREEREIYHTNSDDPDTDHDGLSDKDEVIMHTNPLNPDSDGDGVRDGDELHKYNSNPLEVDTDSDGLKDDAEVTLGTSLWRADTDGDNLNDQVEIARGTDPLNRDTDGDGLPDGLEANSSPLIRDTDGDGLPDAMESAYSLRPYDEDFDKDGLFDWQEVQLGTNPMKADTDNDGVRDYVEVYGLMTDPRNPDTDKDGIPDSIDPEPTGKGMNTQKNVSMTFENIFRHQRAVDETSKGLITLLHLIRSASPGHVREIDIAVYGESTEEATLRRENLGAYLDKMTQYWAAPPLSIYSEVKSKGFPHAKLTYVSK